MKKFLVTVFLGLLLASFMAPLLNLGVQHAEATVTGTFGYTTEGSSYKRDFGAKMVGSLYLCSDTAYVTSISFYAKTTDSTWDVKAFIVDSASKTILGTSDATTITDTLQWWNASFSTPVAVTDGKSYYLMVMAQSNFIDFYHDSSGTELRDESNNYASPSDPTDGTAGTRKYSIYASYSAHKVDVTSEVALPVYVNGDAQTFNYSFHAQTAQYTFYAEQLKIVGDTYYIFSSWLINGTTPSTSATYTVTIGGDTTIKAEYTSGSTSSSSIFLFYGPFSENTGLQLDENVTVTVHYSTADVASESYTFNGTQLVEPNDGDVLYFTYTFEDNSTRRYYVDPSETANSFYIFKGDTSTYTINFMDYTSILDRYPYVAAQAYVNGTYYSVEKVKVDSANIISMNLVAGETYQFLIGDETYTYVYGNVLATEATTIQLILKGTDFPKETLLMYPYLTLYANRTFTGDSDAPIIVRYIDGKGETQNFTVTFTDQNGVVAYSYSTVADDLTVNWGGAADINSYTVSVEIEHTTYGTYTWKQYLQAEGGAPVNLDLSFLGSWSIDLTYFIPIILIVIVAGCFSAMNAEVGAIVAAILAVILTYMGWIPIAPGLLVTALSLAILMALVYNKRRIQPY